MTLRALLFVLAVGLAGLSTGLFDSSMAPSARTVLLGALVGLLAPLFGPGAGGTVRQTILRVVAWPVACAGGTVLSLMVLGGVAPPMSVAAAFGAVLGLVLVVATALAALFERRWHRDATDAAHVASPRVHAATTVVAALALLGGLPLWLGPIGEAAAGRVTGMLDAVVGLSPLTHLAVAAGNDLLRNDWFYERSALAGLYFDYPGLQAVLAAYAVLAMLLLAWLARPRDHSAGVASGAGVVSKESSR